MTNKFAAIAQYVLVSNPFRAATSSSFHSNQTHEATNENKGRSACEYNSSPVLRSGLKTTPRHLSSTQTRHTKQQIQKRKGTAAGEYNSSPVLRSGLNTTHGIHRSTQTRHTKQRLKKRDKRGRISIQALLFGPAS